jgi:phosphopantetheinyl transferase
MITVIDLPFFSGGKEEKCVLSIASTSDFCLEDAPIWLSENELRKFHAMGVEKRKKQYFLGRITTKKALLSFVDGFAFGKINVINKKSGCPIIENSSYSTSITHTDEIVASLVFKRKFSFGIDIENIERGRIETLKSVVFNEENIPEDSKRLTVAWTLKETLSKALCCGFSRSFEEFKLLKFSGNESIFTCSYSKHPEFKGIALIYGNNSYAIAYPTGIKGFQESYCSNFIRLQSPN